MLWFIYKSYGKIVFDLCLNKFSFLNKSFSSFTGKYALYKKIYLSSSGRKEESSIKTVRPVLALQ